MKCSNDQEEMLQGRLFGHGQLWSQDKSILYKVWPGFLFKGSKVSAYKCPKCGRIELISETKEN